MLTLPRFNCGPHELLMLAMNKDKIRPADITFADSMEEKGKTKNNILTSDARRGAIMLLLQNLIVLLSLKRWVIIIAYLIIL